MKITLIFEIDGKTEESILLGVAEAVEDFFKSKKG